MFFSYNELGERRKELSDKGFDCLINSENLPDGVFLYHKCLGHWNDDPKILEHACVFLTSIPTTTKVYGNTVYYFRAYKTKNVSQYLEKNGHEIYNNKDFTWGMSWRKAINYEIDKNRISNDPSLKI